jgi:hypothetical protein
MKNQESKKNFKLQQNYLLYLMFLLFISMTVSAQVTRVQTKTGSSGSSSTSLSVTLGSTPIDGNTLVAIIATKRTSSNTVTRITQTGATWVRATQSTNTSGSTTEIWYTSNVSSASKSITVSQSSTSSAIVIAEYDGILTTNVLDKVNNSNSSSATASTGTTGTTSQGDELIIGGIGLIDSSYSLSSITNSFSTIGTVASGSTPSASYAKVYALEKIVSATSTYSSGGTVSTSSVWSGAIATFKAKVTSTTSVASSDNTSTYGTAVTFTATVSPNTATGTVEFFDGVTSLGTGTLSGTTTKKATLTTTAAQLLVGSHTITANYTGDANSFASTSSAITQTVSPLVVQLSGTRAYDGTTIANSNDLSISNNLDGANLTLSGNGVLSSKDVGTRTIALPSSLSRVQSTTGSTNNTASITMSSLGSTPVNGNTLVAVIATRGNTANRVASITQTGATWTLVSQATNASGSSTTEIWYAPNVTSASKTISISLAASMRAAAVVMEYSGVLESNAIDVTAYATGSSTSASSGTTAITSQDNELLIGSIGLVSSSYSLSAITNSFTTVANVSSGSGTSGNNARVYALEKIVSSASAYTTGGTVSTSSQWSGTIASFKAVLASGTGLALGGSAASNYTMSGYTGSMSITAKPLTITAEDASKCQGTTYTPVSTAFTSTGLQNSETIGNVTLTCSGAASNASAGSYNIVPSAATGGTFTASNYDITYTNGSLTVNPKPAITLSYIDDVSTNATSFTIPYSSIIGSPDLYSVTTVGPNAMPNFVSVLNQTFGSSPLTISIPNSTASEYSFNITLVNSVTGCSSSAYPFQFHVTTLNHGVIGSNQTICAGTTAADLTNVTSSTGAGTITYSWEKSTTSIDSGYSPIMGATSANYSPGVLNETTYFKRIVSNGFETSDSDPITITVNPLLSASVSIAASATTICSGTSVTFTTTPINGGTTPSYQWKVNGSDVGTNSNIYASTTLANNDVVSVVMTSNATSCLTGSLATSNSLTITLNVPVGITAITPAVNQISGSATTTITASGVVGSNAIVSWYTGSGQVGLLGTGLTSPAVSYGTYYAVVTGSCGSPIELSTTIRRVNIWTGAVNTLWNIHGNWSEGIDPDATTDVIIGTGKTVQILNFDAVANSITIEGTGTLTVKSGRDLTLTNGFSTPAATSLVLESNADLIQLSSVANTTPITVKRETSTLKRLDYILWSSPVVGQNMLAFSPLTTLSPTIRFYNYNTSLNYYTSVASPSTTNFDRGIGNLIRLPYNHPTTAATWTGSFAGVPNNGTIIVPITSDPTDANKRYNLIGNPYPSPISINSFIDGNSNNIVAPLYFWRKTNGSTNKSYWAISKVGHTSSGEGTNPNGVIQVGQGFLVQAKANATQVEFNNSMRIIDNHNQFFKSTANNFTNSGNRIWLKLTNATGDFSQALVGYFDNATLGVDEEIDAKDINDGVIGINSVVNNIDYTIQGRPTFNVDDVVTLSYKVTTAGTYTIAIDQVDGLFSGNSQNIFLRDNLLGTCNNLSASSYVFTSNPGSFQNRFELLYQNSLLSNNVAPTFNANSVVIYHQKSDLIINSGVATMSSIKIFNIKGALLFDKKEINASETKVDIGSTNEVLLVEIVTTEGIKVVKKVFSELVIGSDDDE